jgi:hypothetical protein
MCIQAESLGGIAVNHVRKKGYKIGFDKFICSILLVWALIKLSFACDNDSGHLKISNKKYVINFIPIPMLSQKIKHFNNLESEFNFYVTL